MTTMKLRSAVLEQRGTRLSLAQYEIQRMSDVYEALLTSLEEIEGKTSLVYHYYKGVTDTYKELLEHFNNHDNDNKKERPDASLYPGGRDFDPDRDAFG